MLNLKKMPFKSKKNNPIGKKKDNQATSNLLINGKNERVLSTSQINNENKIRQNNREYDSEEENNDTKNLQTKKSSFIER